VKVRLTSRRSADARCAYCHDGLDGALASCPRCFTTFHKDCRAHLAQCPTLGCNTTFTQSPDVAIEEEPPIGLAGELLRERLGTLLLGVVSAASLAALLGARAWSQDTLVVAGFLALGVALCAARFLSELGFYAALPALLRRAPVRMAIEIRSEKPSGEEEARHFVARLTGPAGERLSLLLGATLPAWLLAPGHEVDVFFAGSGPVALRSLRGHLYAVPARSVVREP